MIESIFIFGAYKWCTLGRAYVCLGCGHQWARMKNAIPGFTVITGYCESCKSPWPNDVPGSLYDFQESLHDGHGCAHLPSELLYREWGLLDRGALTTPMQSANITPIEPTQRPQAMTEIADRIAELRSKVLSKTITDAELREGIALLRADRTGASVRRTESKKAAAAKAAPVDVSGLLAALMTPKT